MAGQGQTQILVISDKNAANNASGANSGTSNGSASNAPKWNIIIKSETVVKNSLIRPDGFSCIWFENIGEDKCNIFDSVPVNPESMVRQFNFDPGQIISSQIPVQFAMNSANKQLLITKIYFEKIG